MSSQHNNLNGLAVLITRPFDKAQSFAKVVSSYGGEPIVFSAIDIAPVPIRVKFSLSELQQFAYVIFVSSYAVKYLPQNIKNYLQDNFKNKPKIITLGQGTTNELLDNKIKVFYTLGEGGNSEALLALEFLSAKNVCGKKVLIVGGFGGRQLLEETLKLRCAVVKKIEVYKRVCPQIEGTNKLEAWKNLPQITVMVTSKNILQNLIKIFGSKKSWLQEQPLVVVSQRIECFAKTQGFKNIINAQGLSEDLLLKALFLSKNYRLEV